MKPYILSIAASIMLVSSAGIANAADYGIRANTKSDYGNFSVPQLEIRGGILAHNKGPIASSTESGPDINLALHYMPWIVDVGGLSVGIVGHVGGVVNLSSGTSYGYVGANTHIPFSDSGFFLELGGGFAIHDGILSGPTSKRRAMGSRILFRAETSLGYRFDNGMTLSFMVDHISNGSILSSGANQGLDTFGFRLGQTF